MTRAAPSLSPSLRHVSAPGAGGPSRRRLVVTAACGLGLALTGPAPGLVRPLHAAPAPRLRLAFAAEEFTATLDPGPAAEALMSMLPLDLTIEDYADNEKIAVLPRALPGDGATPFDTPRPGDLCYFAPWRNLVLFYAPYRYSRGLMRLGRLDDGIAPLMTRGSFPLRITALS